MRLAHPLLRAIQAGTFLGVAWLIYDDMSARGEVPNPIAIGLFAFLATFVATIAASALLALIGDRNSTNFLRALWDLPPLPLSRGQRAIDSDDLSRKETRRLRVRR